MSHDFTDLRKCVLKLIASEFGEEDKVEEAMRLFVAARSDIEPHLYDDSMACIEWIRDQGVEVGFLTNGNCDVAQYCPGDLLFSMQLRKRIITITLHAITLHANIVEFDM